MDPNALLDSILAHAFDVIRDVDDDVTPDIDDVTHLAQGLIDLHEWRTKGGFLPDRWERPLARKLAENGWHYFKDYGIDRGLYDRGVVEFDDVTCSITYTNTGTGARLELTNVFYNDDGTINQAYSDLH